MSLHPELNDLLELRHHAQTFGLASHHLVNSAFSGLYASVFRGSGLDFEEVREYREGDDIRNMDWHVTARTNAPHLKVYREERERTVMLCVDRGPHMDFGTRGTFKSIQAAHAAALLGWAANTHHDRVGGLLFGEPGKPLEYFRADRGWRTLWRVLRTLAEPTSEGAPAEEDSLVNALKRLDRGTPTGSLIFVIAALNRDVTPLEKPLGALRQRHTVVLLPVDDPADQDIPSMGRVVFSGPDGNLVEIDTDNDAGRRLYRMDWDKNRHELQSMANSLGITLIPLHTQQDVHRAITEGLWRRTRVRVVG